MVAFSASFEKNMPEIGLNLSLFFFLFLLKLHPFEWVKEKWILKARNGRGEESARSALTQGNCRPHLLLYLEKKGGNKYKS